MLVGMMKFGTESGRTLYDDRFYSGHPMMWGWGDGGSFLWIHAFLGLITWALVIAVLFALARWLWKKGDRVK